MVSWDIVIGLLIVAFVLPYIFLHNQLQAMVRRNKHDRVELEQLRHQNMDLQQHVARDKELFLNALGVPFVLLRPSGRLIMANREAGELLGFDASSNINLLRVLPALAAPLREAIQNALDQPEEAHSTLIHWPQDLNGEERYIQLSATPLHNNEKHIGLVLRDVTQNERTLQMRRDFVANASHELRTPLTIIRGYLETLIDEPDTADDPTQRTRALSLMKTHTERIVRLVEDMLTISRLERGDRALLRMEDFALQELVAKVAERLEPVSAAQGAAITLLFPPAPLQLHGDPFYWSQVFYNLMENALKNNAQKSDLALCLRAEQRADGSVSISVEDNGCGITPDKLPYIFNRFYRADETGRVKGTGLGLSIVRHAVEAHGGHITAESERNTRTRFTIELPPTA